MHRIAYIFILFLLSFAQAGDKYQPFGKTAWLTSSFGESRGNRYHAGIDFSTNMEEGWAVLAPADGAVEFAARSPFGYGRYIKFLSKDNHLWVFAHLSKYNAKIDSIIRNEMLKKENASVSAKMNISFKKGDTLAYSGSTGIGEPHLHIEMRNRKGDITLNPCTVMECPDTVKPIFLGLGQFRKMYAVKILDYSREPYNNPMSIYSLEVWQNGKKKFEKKYDKLSFDSKEMLKIREDLLWAENADTAGNWHLINAPLSNKSKIKIIAKDFAGNVLEKETYVSDSSVKPLVLRKYQDSTLYTFLSQIYSDEQEPFASSHKKNLQNKDVKDSNAGVVLNYKGISKTFLPSVSSWRKAGDVFEFHPKGLQLDSWEACFDTTVAPHPLYWLGETSRKWFYFSNQTLKNGKRCIKTNELRDIGSFLDTIPPETGKAYIKDKVCRIPVLDSLSGFHFASANIRSGEGKWVIFDYDSDPQEIVIEKTDYPNSPVFIKLCDETKNCKEHEIKCVF